MKRLENLLLRAIPRFHQFHSCTATLTDDPWQALAGALLLTVAWILYSGATER